MYTPTGVREPFAGIVARSSYCELSARSTKIGEDTSTYGSIVSRSAGETQSRQ